MKRIRSMPSVFVTVFAALALALSPSVVWASAASAEPSRDVAAAAEFDQAVAGSPPAGMPCVATRGATACFESYGDKWWVKDTEADSASAEAEWYNYRNGVLYRAGICRNSMGNGTWGVCNKNYYEDSTVEWTACVFDASAGELIRCA